jgi:hypothetical protein
MRAKGSTIGQIEKPMLFTTLMVPRLLDDRKTQTRRMIKRLPVKPNNGFISVDRLTHLGPCPYIGNYCWQDKYGNCTCAKKPYAITCPHPVGSLIWVKETWRPTFMPTFDGGIDAAYYRADFANDDIEANTATWKPSIHMPRKFARIWLEVTAVRVERLQDISEDDALAEGAYHWWQSLSRIEQETIYTGGRGPCGCFKDLWIIINGKESWERNPWLWVYTFKRVEAPTTTQRNGEAR